MLEAIGIKRRAGEVTLLNDVTLTLRPGQQRAIIGSSGSGKTLLLRSLARLDPIESGEIRWQGKLVFGADTPQFRSRVVYLHQRPALVEGTVEHNLQLPFSLKVHGDKSYDRDLALRLLKSVGRQQNFFARHQRDLSGGEIQITALVRTLLLEPDVLLLDEPTAAIDADTTVLVETAIANWISQALDRRSILWATHDLKQAKRMGTEILEMRNGSLFSKNKPSQLE